MGSIQVYSTAGPLRYELERVRSASLYGTLSGERTFEFSVPVAAAPGVIPGDLIIYAGVYYDVVRVTKRAAADGSLLTVGCEHVSYRLSDIPQTAAVFQGTPAAILQQILQGTDFSAGTVEMTGTWELNIERDTSVRDAVMQLAAITGLEVDYSGYSISLLRHIGSSIPVVLSRRKNLTGLVITQDLREEQQTYDLTLYKETELGLGGAMTISYDSLGIDATARIIAIRYDPFQKRQYSLTVGDYAPTFTVSTLGLMRIMQDRIEHKVELDNLNTLIGQYVDSAAGTAKIVSACSATYQTIAGMSDYVLSNSLNASIGQYIDSSAGTAKIVSACSATYQTIAGMSDYVLQNSLNASIGQYIDSAAGTAKIVSAASGTFQTISGMSDYPTTTQVATEIAQSVSPIQSAISLTAAYGSGSIGSNVRALLELVANADSSAISIKADKINFTGFTTFLRASDVGSGGSTSIDGGRILTGTVSADRIDVNSLHVEKVYSAFSDNVALLYCTGTGVTNAVLHLGADSNAPDVKNIYVHANGEVKVTAYGYDGLVFDTADYTLAPESNAFSWSLGTASLPFKALVVRDITLRGSASNATLTLTTASSGTTTFTLSPSINKGLTIGSANYQLSGIYTDSLTVGTSLTVGGVNPVTTMRASYSSSVSYSLTMSAAYNSAVVTPSAAGVISLGSSSYPLAAVYCGSGSTRQVNIASALIAEYSSSYYQTVTLVAGLTSAVLTPYTNYTLGSVHLGSSSAKWGDLYTVSAHLCDSSSAASLGFFGHAANTRQTLSTTSQNMGYTAATASNYLIILNNLVGILKEKYGLIN